MAKQGYPKLCLHRPSGQAYVRFPGNSRPEYLGEYGTKESERRYDELIGEYLANGRRMPPKRSQDEITVQELAIRFLDWAEGYYVKNGKKTETVRQCRLSLAPLVKSYGNCEVSEVGPIALKFVRERMISDGLCRGTVNSRIGTIQRVFQWGVENEMIPPDVFQALDAVASLKKGRSEARETGPVPPVDDKIVDKTLSFLPKTVADMVRVQRLIAGRPQDVYNMRACDIVDRSDPECWVYTPFTHKTEHKNKRRIIHVGPKAQAILTSYLQEKADTPEAFLFSPADSKKIQKIEKRRKRKTKVQPSQVNRTKPDPKRKPREQYDHHSYRQAVHRACMKAGIEIWSPNQLRHTAATEIVSKYGPIAAKEYLGHSDLGTTLKHYVGELSDIARKVAVEIG